MPTLALQLSHAATALTSSGHKCMNNQSPCAQNQSDTGELILLFCCWWLFMSSIGTKKRVIIAITKTKTICSCRLCSVVCLNINNQETRRATQLEREARCNNLHEQRRKRQNLDWQRSTANIGAHSIKQHTHKYAAMYVCMYRSYIHSSTFWPRKHAHKC